MTYIKIALRNLSRQKKRTVLLGGAIAFGILFVTLINGFAGSFVTNVGENFANILGGHIFVEGLEKLESGRTIQLIKDSDVILRALDDTGLDYRFVTMRSTFRGTFFFEGRGVTQTIVGADWEKDHYFTERIILRDGSFEDLHATADGIIISRDVAELLGASLGDRVSVRLQTDDGRFNSGYMFIVGISADPGIVGSIATFANLPAVNKLLGIGENEYMSMGIFLYNLADIPAIIAPFTQNVRAVVQILDKTERNQDEQDPFEAMMAAQKDEERWDGIRYRITNLNESLSEVQEIVDVLNAASIIILIILFCIIMVGINNTFRIVMYERIREIGTMRALGLQQGGISAIFLLEAIFIALSGVVAGLLISAITMFVISLIPLGTGTGLFILLKNGYFTFQVEGWQIVLNTLIVCLLTLLAAALPARTAARLEPAVALRTQK
jgi:putative ABC transport system permease protein